MNVLTLLIIYPAVIFAASLTAIYLWGFLFAFIMSAIAAVYCSYAYTSSRGIMGNGNTSGSSASNRNTLLLIAKSFVAFLVYALVAAWVANYSHAHMDLFPYLLFSAFSSVWIIVNIR